MAAVSRVPKNIWCSSDRQLGVHHIRYNLGEFNWLPHTHPEYNFIFSLSGGMEFWVEGRREPLAPWDVLIINPGELHYGKYGTAHGPSEGIGLHVSERRLREVLARAFIPFDVGTKALGARGKVGDLGRVALPEIVRELGQRRSGYELVLDSLVSQLLVDLFRAEVEVVGPRQARRALPELSSWEMVGAVEYMSCEGKSDFNLPDLCSLLGTSPSRFTRLFKNSSGMKSPHAYYNEMVVMRAKNLLAEQDRSIKRIAYDLGFRNDSHFCRLFRKLSGQSPQRYRAWARLPPSPPSPLAPAPPPPPGPGRSSPP